MTSASVARGKNRGRSGEMAIYQTRRTLELAHGQLQFFWVIFFLLLIRGWSSGLNSSTGGSHLKLWVALCGFGGAFLRVCGDADDRSRCWLANEAPLVLSRWSATTTSDSLPYNHTYYIHIYRISRKSARCLSNASSMLKFEHIQYFIARCYSGYSWIDLEMSLFISGW